MLDIVHCSVVANDQSINLLDLLLDACLSFRDFERPSMPPFASPPRPIILATLSETIGRSSGGGEGILGSSSSRDGRLDSCRLYDFDRPKDCGRSRRKTFEKPISLFCLVSRCLSLRSCRSRSSCSISDPDDILPSFSSPRDLECLLDFDRLGVSASRYLESRRLGLASGCSIRARCFFFRFSGSGSGGGVGGALCSTSGSSEG